MQTNTTPTLLQAIRQDPDTGLRWAMRDYAALVRGIARRILPGHDRDIEECTADVFVALWRNAARLEATGHTGAGLAHRQQHGIPPSTVTAPYSGTTLCR